MVRTGAGGQRASSLASASSMVLPWPPLTLGGHCSCLTSLAAPHSGAGTVPASLVHWAPGQPDAEVPLVSRSRSACSQGTKFHPLLPRRQTPSHPSLHQSKVREQGPGWAWSGVYELALGRPGLVSSGLRNVHQETSSLSPRTAVSCLPLWTGPGLLGMPLRPHHCSLEAPSAASTAARPGAGASAWTLCGLGSRAEPNPEHQPCRHSQGNSGGLTGPLGRTPQAQPGPQRALQSPAHPLGLRQQSSGFRAWSTDPALDLGSGHQSARSTGRGYPRAAMAKPQEQEAQTTAQEAGVLGPLPAV